MTDPNTKLTDAEQQRLSLLLAELHYASSSFVTALAQPTPLVLAMSWVRSIHRITVELQAMELELERQVTYAVNARSREGALRPTIHLHDLDSMRAPESPEGLS